MAFFTIFTVFGAIIAVSVAVVYYFGIPPETKRKLERQAINTMGENKVSYAVKDGISMIPDGNSQDLQGLKTRVSKTFGAAAQNPIGERTGEVVDRVTAPVTAPVTGRQGFQANSQYDSNNPVLHSNQPMTGSQNTSVDSSKPVFNDAGAQNAPTINFRP